MLGAMEDLRAKVIGEEKIVGFFCLHLLLLSKMMREGILDCLSGFIVVDVLS
jgi:hypothetical protein